MLTVRLLGRPRLERDGVHVPGPRGHKAWALLAREVIGTANLDAQLDDGLPAAVYGLPAATIDETCRASTIVLLS